MFRRLTSLAVVAAILTGLQALTTAADPDVVIRRAWAASDHSFEAWSNLPNGIVSPDGQWLTWVEGQNQIVRYRIRDGQRFVVTAAEKAVSISDVVWSPGSDQVAYYQSSAGSRELRVARVAGGAPRVIARTGAKDPGLIRYIPLGWSADGTGLVVHIPTTTSDDLAIVTINTGEARVFKTIPRQPNRPVFLLEADRTSVTIGRVQGTNREIIAIDIRTGREANLVRLLADDVPLAWTPDGKRLLFVSNRGGSPAVWSIEVGEGKALALPVLVWRVPGMPISGSISRDQTLYVALNRHTTTDVYTADWDPQSGKVTGLLRPAAERYATFNSAPDWSRDGERFVLQVGGPDNPDGIDLLVRSLQSSEDRIVRPQMAAFSRPRFSVDGRSVVVQGATLKPLTSGVQRIDLESGVATLLVPNGRNPAWSRDGERLFFEITPRVMMQDQRTGTTTELYRASESRRFNSAPAPDGERVAVEDDRSLLVVDVASRQVRKILELKAPERFEFPGSLAWTPDGQWLLFGKMNGSRGELWRISAQGGQPLFTGLEVPNKFIYFLRVHPDGRQLAFAIGDATLHRREIWALQNFPR
jgi:Tol biopolymer transport system component